MKAAVERPELTEPTRQVIGLPDSKSERGSKDRATSTETHAEHAFRVQGVMNSTFFGLLAEFGEANIPLEKVAPKYFGLSYNEARRSALAKLLPCRAFRLGGQKSPWLVSAADLAELIDRQRSKTW